MFQVFWFGLNLFGVNKKVIQYFWHFITLKNLRLKS